MDKKNHKKNLFAIGLIVSLLILLLPNIASAQEGLPIGLQRLKEYEQQLASNVTFILAFFAGLISMTSPCGIALLPAFFSFAFKDRKKAVLMTSAFSLGLLTAFVLFGLIAGLLGNFFNAYKLAFAVVSGFVLMLFGILLFFNIGLGTFSFKQDYRKAEGIFSAAIIGFFFGIGWTPCVGPILAGILILAANSATVLNGTLMLVFYGIGIAAPLIALAYFSDRYDLTEKNFFKGKIFSFNLFNKKIITHTYNLIGGALLIALGALIAMFEGTFFFQTELPKFIPWSMSFWGYLNESALGSGILTSSFGNIFGIIAALLIVVFAVWHLKKNLKKSLQK